MRGEKVNFGKSRTTHEQERARKKAYWERRNCRRNNEEDYDVRVIEGKEVREDDPIKSFLSTRIWTKIWMTVEVTRMKRFLEEGRTKGKKESDLHSLKKRRLEKHRRLTKKEEFFSRILIPK